MKLKHQTLIATFLFAFISFFGFSQLERSKAPMAIAEISLETTTIDYGIIEQNSDGIRTLSFKNTGDAPLVISKVKASCGCTVPSFSKTPVAPGEEGSITVSYDTKRLGKFSKTVTITSNAAETTKQFKITGEVVRTLK